MKTNNRTSKLSSFMKGSCALALLCSAALPLGISSAQAQSLDSYDSYTYDMDNAPQIAGSNYEFFLGQSVQTQPQGSLQMIVGGSHERGSDAQGSQRFSEITARAEYGVTDRLQLQAALPYQIDDRPGSYTSQDNVGNVQVGATYSLLRADDPISMSAGMDVQIPVGHQANLNRMDVRGSDQTLYKPQLIVARDFGPTQVHANAQAELGNRVLAIAWKAMPANVQKLGDEDESDLTVAGFCVFVDPPHGGPFPCSWPSDASPSPRASARPRRVPTPAPRSRRVRAATPNSSGSSAPRSSTTPTAWPWPSFSALRWSMSTCR